MWFFQKLILTDFEKSLRNFEMNQEKMTLITLKTKKNQFSENFLMNEKMETYFAQLFEDVRHSKWLL